MKEFAIFGGKRTVSVPKSITKVYEEWGHPLTTREVEYQLEVYVGMNQLNKYPDKKLSKRLWDILANDLIYKGWIRPKFLDGSW